MKNPSVAGQAFIDEISAMKQKIKELEQSLSESRRIAGALRESEAKFKEFFETLEDLYYQTDSEGIIRMLSPSLYRMSGWTEEELLGKPASTVYVNPDDREWLLRELTEKGHVHDYEIVLKRKDGMPVQASLSARMIVDENGRQAGVIGSLRDITERKQAEEKLKKQTDAIEASMDGIAILNEDQRYVYLNKSHAGIYGYDAPRDLLGRSWRVLYDKDELQRFDHYIMPEFTQKGFWQGEAKGRKKDGTTFRQEISLTALDDGGLVCVVRDITERKQAEEAIKAARADTERVLKFNEALLSAIPTPVFYKDQEGRYLGCNRAFTEIMGVTSEEIAGKTVMELWPGEHAEVYHAKDLELLSNPERQVYEFKVRDKSGMDRTVIFAKDIFLDEHGQPAGIVGSFLDISDRKRAEEALRENEERQKAILGNVGASIYLKDTRYRYTYVNNQVCSLFGLEEEEIIGKDDSYFFIASSVEEIMRSDRRVIEDGETVSREESNIISSDGMSRTYWAVKLPLRDGNNNICGLCGISTDITGLKRIQEDLATSEEIFRSVVNKSPMGIHIYALKDDDRLVFVRSNPAADKMTGVDNSQFIGKTLEEAFPPLAGTETAERYRRAARDGESWYTEQVDYEYGRIKGAFEVHAFQMSQGKVAVLFDEVTEQRRTEKDLREKTEELDRYFTTSLDLFCIADTEGYFRRLNPQWETALGYRLDELEGKRFLDFVHPDDLEATVQAVSRLGAQERVLNFTNRYRCRDGTYRWIEWRSIPSGKTIFAAARDITERKRLEAQLVQAQKTEAIGTLAGGIAHDFNNILTSLMGYTTLMQMKMDKDSPLQPYVGQIMKASKKAADLTKSLLAFSRQQPITLVPIDMNTTIEETQKLLKRLLTEDIDLKIRLSTEMPVVMADKTQIDQILFNLVTNARDAMPGGGTLTIETSNVRSDDDFVRVHSFGKDGKYLRLTVADTGTGMDSATVEKIFDPFFTTKEVGKGTGLGLATVYGIVKQHNGFITVESRPEQGTAFHVYFPTVTSAVDATEDQMVPVKTGKEKILIAEDNNEVRFFIREALREHGYTTIEAVDGEDAVETFKKNRDVALVIIDSVMPKKNGRQVYEEIHGMVPGVKTLFTSGYTKDIVLDKGVEEKEFDFIAKPVSLDTLLEKVRDILDRE